MSRRVRSFAPKFPSAILTSLAAMLCLFSTGLAGAQTTLTATSVSFGNVVSGESSAPITVTLKNAGVATISLASVMTSPSPLYSVEPASTCLTAGTLAHNATCSIILEANPASVGAQAAGTLTVTSSAPNSPQSIPLSVAGIAPTTLSATTEAFGYVVVGETSAIKTFTLKNNQLAPLTLGISSITAPAGGYAVDPSTTCGTTLAAGATCTIAITLTPTALGAAPAGAFTVSTNASNSPQSVSVTGTGVNPTTLSVTAEAFGSVAVGETSAIKTFTLKNNQLAPLTLGISSITPPAGGYALDPSTTCGITLAAGATCTIAITFTPSALGATPAGSVSIAMTNPAQSLSVAVTGTGVNPTTLSATTEAFGYVVVGETSAIKTFTLKNNQLAPLTLGISSITAPAGGYALDPSTTCGSTLAAGATCTVAVTFTPAALGVAPAGSVSIATTNPAQSLSVAVTGTGVNPTTLSVTAEAFGSVAVGETSAIKTFTLKNNQLAPLTLGITSITAPAGGYAIDPSTTCGTTLAGGATCTVAMTFTPAALGVAPAGSVSIVTTNPAQSLSVAVSGTGVNPTTLSVTAEAFGSVAVGETSAIKTFTLKNNQLAPLTLGITSITAPAGGYAIDPSTTCGTTLAGGATCTVAVTFTPAALGVAPAGSVSIVTTNPAQSLSVTVTGTGVNPTTLSATAEAFGSVAVGETSAIKSFTLKNNQLAPLTLGITSITAPAGGYAIDPSTTCGTTLAGGATCTVAVTFTPAALGVAPAGSVSIVTTNPVQSLSVAVTGTGVNPTTLSVTTEAFGNVVAGEKSVIKSFTLKNNQLAPLTLGITSITAPAGGYAIDPSTTCGTTLAPGATCTIGVTFTPSALGIAPVGSVSIVTTNPAQTLSVALTGTGVAEATTTLTSLAFGSVAVGAPSVLKSFTLKNVQAVPLGIISITPTSALYNVDPSTTCGSSLGVGGSCTIGVTLTPAVLGVVPAASLVITTNAPAPNVPINIPMTGTGVAPVTVSPTTISFATQPVGTTSNPAKTVTIANAQVTKTLHVTGTAISGTNSSDFGVTNPCASIAPLTNCALPVTFTPSLSGARTATLTIQDDSATSPHTVTLNGNGNAPVGVTPLSLTSFTAPVGSTSTVQTVTIKNNDATAPLTINSFQITGDFKEATTSCGTPSTPPNLPPYTLAAGASCTLTIQFAPTVGGTRTGQLQVNDSALTSPQVVNLSGTGTSPLTILPTSLTFPAQPAGTTSTPKSLVLTNHESQSETFTLNPPADYTANSSCSSGTINANSTCTISVSFAPGIGTANGPDNKVMTISDSAAVGSTLSVPLTGSVGTPQAAVAEVQPGVGGAGTHVPVVITGNGFTHFTNSSVITFTDTNSSSIPSDITVTNIVAVSANVIDATLVIGANTVSNPVTFGARNITVRTGSESAFLNSAFTIYDPTNVHDITMVNPGSGAQGQTLNVALTASGTHFIQGTTFVNFGTGITINSLTITDPTDAVANISISNTTSVGSRTITMVTGGEYASSTVGAFQVTSNGSTLVSVSPNVEPQSFAGTIALTAAGTHFQQNATTVSISGGVIVGDVQVTSPTTATAQVALSTATPGTQDVTVSTGGEIETLPSSFTVTGSTPALLSVSPTAGVQGQNNLNVVIVGNAFTNFSTTGGATMLADFTGQIVVNSITVNSPHQATVNISINQTAPTGGLTARLTSTDASNNVEIFPFTFTVNPSSAAIVSVVPNNVPQGGQVTLTVTGVNTIWNQPQSTSQFYPELVPTPNVDEITVNSPTSASLNISVPTNTPPGNYPFYIATGGQVVSSTIHVYANTPSVMMTPSNGLVPNSGVNSFTVNFNGQFTTWAEGNTNANLNTQMPVISGEGVTFSNFQVTSPISATATVTIAAGAATTSRLVTITTGSQIVTTYFNVTSKPVAIISVNPPRAPQNTTLNVTIVGLNTHFCDNVTTTCATGIPPSQVLFGPEITVNSVSVQDNTHLTANVTTAFTFNSVPTTTQPGYQTVFVNTGNEQVTGSEQVLGAFSVDPPASPTLLSVVPSSAPQGSTETVTITGSLTNWCGLSATCANPTEAILGAGVTVSNLAITSPTTATATISVSPTAPVGGNSVTMITGTEIEGGVGFSVTPSAAYIQSVGPTVVCNANAGEFVAANFCGGGSGSGTPYEVGQLQTTTLNVVGVGTHWLQGDTTFNFGAGVIVDQLTVTSPTTATVQITVLSSSPVGYASLTTYTDGESVTLQQAIDIEEGFPKLLAISPNSGEEGATVTIQVLGRFTHFGPTTNVAFNETFPGEITVNSTNVVDNDTMTVTATVNVLAYVDYAYPCGHVMTITTGGEQVSTAPILDNFCVQTGAAQINSVTAPATPAGTTGTLTITGSATHFEQGVTSVSFGDPNLSVPTQDIVVTSPTTLTATFAANTNATPGFKTVTVSTFGEVASQQFAYTVVPDQATLTEANPNQAQQGAQLYLTPAATGIDVKLTGQYSHFSNLSTATFGPGIVVNSVTLVSATQITANITIDPLAYAGGRVVTVTTPGIPCSLQSANVTYVGCTPGVPTGTGSEIVSANAFTVITGPAIISHVAPNTGNEGQEIVFNITGNNTHWQQNFTQFYIAGGGSDLTINSVIINSPTSATVDMNISPTANPGARSIFMVTAGESLTDSGAFVVTGGVPAIAYISPGGALTGAGPVEVTIHGIYTLWAPGRTTLNFGPGVTVSSYQVDDNFNIEAVLGVDSAATPGYHAFSVTTGNQVLTGNFLVTAAPGSPGASPPPSPFIWSESPSAGLPGQTLNVYFSGLYTHWNPDPISGTQFSFGSGITVNTCQVLGQTSALCNITITATVAQTNLVVFTTGTETETANFNVVIAQPELSVVDPGSGLQGGTNINVNIIGQYTTFDATTTFSFGPGITVNGPPVILGPTIATQNISIDQLAQTGGRSVVAYTQDAAPIAQTVSGAGFSVTPSLALISALNPNISPQGSVITGVVITGQNTHWNPSTVFQFGSGITVTNTNVTSYTSATVSLSIPAYASEGPTYVSATTGGEVASINNGFVITAGTPYLLSSGPGSLPQQSSATFTILAQQTNWSAATPPAISYGAGIVLTNVNVTSPQSMTATGYVQPTTPVGYRSLTVTNGSQVLGLSNVFYVSPGPAVINSVTTNTGGQGANLSVQITGTNTNWQQGVTSLSFPGVLVNSFVVNNTTMITANITVSDYATAGQVSVTATTGGEVATGVNVFTITQTQPELLAVVPSSAPQAWTTQNVTLTGDFTHFSTATSVANFGAGVTVNSVTANSATSLVANVTVQPTASLGYRNVTVTTGTEVVSLTNSFRVVLGPAAISNLSPAGGAQNTQVSLVVTGSQTHFNGNGAMGAITTASFSGGIVVTNLTVTDASHANVTVSIPSTTPVGSYNVTLTTGGEVATILGGFTVGSGNGTISNVNPPTGHQGAVNLNVALTGLLTNWVNGTSVASFGAGITVNSLTVTGATVATANISISQTATIASRNVTVTTGSNVATIVGGFSVLAGVPTLTSATPGSAQAGTSTNVVIDGAFTNFVQGTSTVSFGSGVTVNTVTVTSPTVLTASITVASNASVGSRDVNVVTGAENVTLSGGFTVLAGTPVVTQINPNIGTQNANVVVTILGQYTNWVNGTTTANFGAGISVGGATAGTAGPVSVNSAGNLTANLTISTSAAFGPRDVVVTTGGEVDTVPAGFTVQPTTISPPTVISLSPGANSGGIPINSDIIVVFSQPMNRTTITTSDVLLSLESNQRQGAITVPGTVTVDATGRVLTFAPSAPLAVNSQFYFNLTSAIKDASGNTFSNFGEYLYTAYTATSTPVTVAAINPIANSTTVGTNATVQLEFSADMNQATASGLVISQGSNPVAGTLSWNSGPTCNCGGGNVATFTPAAPLSANTTYTVTYGSPLADTVGNAVMPGSFNFTTTAGPDTTQNSTFVNFGYFEENIGTNFVPTVYFAKPVNALDINTSTVHLYNYDSGKYLQGTVTLAPNGLSATFTPLMPLLPQTAYTFAMSGGYYDMDGVYLSGGTNYFITGNGSDLAPPTVSSVSPANSAASVPLNAQVVVHFSEVIDANSIQGSMTVTPSGGSPITGTATLASDQVTLTFVPAAALLPNKTYNVQVTGYRDLVGNAGSTFNSSFTTFNALLPLNVSTGFTSGGTLSTVPGTPDANWTATVSPNPSAPAQVIGPGAADWYGGFQANGPKSSWIAANAGSATGNSSGTISTTFNLTGYPLTNLCLVGLWGVDSAGSLQVNGNPITVNMSSSSLVALNIALPTGYLNSGVNTLTMVWGSGDNNEDGFRMQAAVQTCGSTLTGGLTVTGTSPANGATNVATNSTITMTFNNPLDPATVTDTTLPVMVGWNSNHIIAGTWAVSGNQATFTPEAPFPPSTQLYVGNCGGPYDTAGDTFNGCYGTQFLQFTTSSTATAVAPFQVAAFSPSSGATNVGLRAPITATFNRSFNPSTINPSGSVQNFVLYNGDTSFCNSYARSQDNTTLQFNCYALPASSTMTAVINSSLQDNAGNGVVPFRSEFMTSGTDYNGHASIIATRPTNGAGSIGVNSQLVLYSNLPISPSTVNGGLQVAQNNVALNGTTQVLDNGYTLVFTPSSPLTQGALVQWWITGGLADATYGSSFNTTNGYFYVVADTSTTTPTIQVLSPVYGSSGNAPNTIVDVQFNVPLDPATVNSTNIYLHDNGTGLNVNATYSMPQPNEVRIIPQSDLSANTYTYMYTTTGLHSTTSVPAQAQGQYFYMGSGDDTTLPTVVSAVPYSGASNVGVNDNVSIVLSKPVDPVSVNSTTFQVSNGATPQAGTYTIDNTDTRITFTPSAPLPANSTLTVAISGMLDRVGHPVSFNSHFQTSAGPDFTAPYVAATSIPTNGTVPTNTTLTVEFSESMDVTTFNGNNLYIYDTTLGVHIPATLTWSSDQSVAYLTPSSPLANGRQYYLQVVGGSDLGGNTLQGTSYYFYAGFSSASSAPTVTAASPLNGATGVGTNAVIEAAFSAAVDPGTLGSITFTTSGNPVGMSPSLSSGNTLLRLTPSVPLLANTAYVVTITGVKDPAGNTVPTYTYDFTTGAVSDLTAPSVINYNPPYGTTVGTNTAMKMIFSKQINPLTVSTSTFRLNVYQTGQYLPVTVTPSADGLSATVQPQVLLLPGTEYHLQACCGYQDFNGNNGNQLDDYFYTGSGPDTTAPTVVVNPVSGSTGIPLNPHILVSISEAIDPTSWTQGSVQLLDNLNNPVAGTVTQPDNQTLMFVPAANLNASTAYHVKVSNFSDPAGNVVAMATSSFTTGSSAATPGLTLVSTNIPFGSSGVSQTQSIIMTFSQILDPTTVNSATLKVMNGWNSNYPLAGTYTVNGNQVTFTPTSPYPAGAAIYVGECGGPTDILGDVFLNGGCYGQQLVYFNVINGSPDTTPLQVSSVSPANGATAVGVNVPVSITFNKSINPSTINANDSVLFAGQSIVDRGSFTLSSDDRTITFNNGALSGGTAYTISISAGGISDPSGNSLASTFTSTFTTASYPATGNGNVQAVSPSNNATGIPTTSLLTLYLNRPVNPSTLGGNFIVTVNGNIDPGTVQATAGNYEVQYTPTTPFPNSAIVQWFFSNVLDVNGDYFNSTSGTFYMAAAVDPTAAPQLVAASPYTGSTSIPANTQVDLQFSLPIDATTISSGFVTSNFTPASITLVTPTLVRIVPTALTSGNFTYVCVNSNLKGTNGVTVQGSCYSTYFYPNATGPDTTPGTVTVGPPNGSIGVGTNAYIRLAFSKPVDRTSVNATTVQVTQGGNPIPGTFSYVVSNSDVTGVNFSPVNPLPPSSVIQVATNGLLDYAGNTFTPVTTHFTTAAAPDYSNATVYYDFGGNTQNIATNASFVCRYSKPMDPSTFNPSSVYVYDYATSTKIPITFTFSSDMMTLTLTPTSPLTASTEYNYECYNALDLTGNAQNNNGGPYFYTGTGTDTAGPVLVYSNPPNGSTNVALNDNNGPWNSTSLMLLFNEPVASTSLGNITLTPQGGSPLAIGTSTEIGDTAVIVQLPSALLPNKVYTFNVSGVTDYAGNVMTPVTSSFTTGSSLDFSSPTESAFVPANGATAVSVSTPLSITYSEPMNPVLFISGEQVLLRTHNTQTLVPTTLSFSPDFRTVYLTPTVPLTASTIYDLMSRPYNWYLTDFAGNNDGDSQTSTFTTGP